MRIVQNLTRSELDAYVKQPTAKKLRDKVMKDGTYIPAGDKDAAAVYVDSRQKEGFRILSALPVVLGQ